jgi:hypothetical protein
MDNNKFVEKLLKADGINPDGPSESERIAFSELFDKQFKSRLFNMKYRLDNTFLKITAAAIILIAAGIIMYNKTGSLDGASIAWADVVKQFNSIAFFNASVYIKEKATDEPVQIEVWRNSRKKARIRVDGQVLFADGGRVIAGYAIDSPAHKIETEEYNEMGMAMARKLFSFQEFSLDTVIEAFGVGKDRMRETTPLINPAATISEDMLVFDVQSDISPEWMRIWVLRESRLPIRIRSWDPRDGDCVDIVMTYSVEQSAKFFDPNAYEQVLLEVQQGAGAGGSANLAYALLQDPGGKDYTPKDLFEKAKTENVTSNAEDVSGYHLPKVEQAGVTEYGAVWIMASQSNNIKPDGHNFFGFSDISDDQQRKYHSIHSIRRSRDDVSIQVFVPEGYPFDTVRPGELTLRCSTEATSPYEKELLIGNVKLDNWQNNVLWPQDRLKLSELQVILRQAWRKTETPEFCHKILDLVRRLDTANLYSHEIEKVRLRMLIKEKKYKDAAALAASLLPDEFEAFKKAKQDAAYYNFNDYIVAFAAHGEVQKAADLYREIKQLQPDLDSFPASTRKHLLERLKYEIQNGSLYALIEPLFSAGLNLEQVNQIVGFDTLNNEDTKWCVPEKFRRQRDQRVIKQEEYMKKLTEQYKKTPLKPGQMVLNQCKLKEVEYMGPISEVKDHYFYIFNMELHKFLKGYKSAGQEGRTNRIRIEEGIDNPVLQHEIIFNSPKGFLSVKFDECREFVMSEFGLEAIESQAIETVLVAEYDGSVRKDYRDVRCPAVRGSTSTPGMISMSIGTGISLRTVLDSLARHQGMMVVNNTKIDDKTIITCEVPNFKTAKGMELAEKWYKDNFGITFCKEQQKLPVWNIQKVK